MQQKTCAGAGIHDHDEMGAWPAEQEGVGVRVGARGGGGRGLQAAGVDLPRNQDAVASSAQAAHCRGSTRGYLVLRRGVCPDKATPWTVLAIMAES